PVGLTGGIRVGQVNGGGPAAPNGRAGDRRRFAPVAKSALEPRQPACGATGCGTDLGAIVFADAGKRAPQLNKAIVHPTVYRRDLPTELIYHFFMLRQFVVVLELPLLFEKSGAGMLPGADRSCRCLLCRPEQQLGETEMKRNAQLTVEQKCGVQPSSASQPSCHWTRKVTRLLWCIDNQHSEAHSRDQAVRLYKRTSSKPSAVDFARSLFTAGVASTGGCGRPAVLPVVCKAIFFGCSSLPPSSIGFCSQSPSHICVSFA
uniref:Uncharacterized protein n=1 Tax=Macrostomum lignano TaxID=282301 RepID=A0A1I8JRW4_9PLAT